MSRIGNLPIEIPAGVEVSAENDSIKVKGPKGELLQNLNDSISLEISEKEIQVRPKDSSRQTRALQGTIRSLIANMITGVVSPYSKDLLIEGVGFRAAVKGTEVGLELGYSHPINHPIPEGVSVTVADNVKIHVEGPDKQKVGQLAAEIKSYYPVEPYKGKGVRIVGEYVRRKEGKKSA
ncbi:MAG TPA: 50S ribosomal protein L6 [Opitutae bacterium]|nr:50S ribosomal protein L6 [Opitutae bacterium]